MEALDQVRKTNQIFEDYKFSSEEIRIYNLAKQYESTARASNNYLTMFPKNKDPRESKYWNVFVKFKERYEGVNIDTHLFFKAQFVGLSSGERFITQFLNAESSYKRYRDYMSQYKDEQGSEYNFSKSVCKEIYKTHKFINEYLVEKGFEAGNFSAFFGYKEDFNDFIGVAMKFVIQRYISLYYVAMSRSFGEEYMVTDTDIRNQMITKEEIKELRLKMINNPEIVDYAKYKFGEKEIVFWKYDGRTKEKSSN